MEVRNNIHFAPCVWDECMIGVCVCTDETKMEVCEDNLYTAVYTSHLAFGMTVIISYIDLTWKMEKSYDTHKKLHVCAPPHTHTRPLRPYGFYLCANSSHFPRISNASVRSSFNSSSVAVNLVLLKLSTLRPLTTWYSPFLQVTGKE